MNIRNKLLAACTLSAAASSAWAVDPTLIDDTPPVILRVGGATATDNTLRNLFAVATNGPCQAGSLDIYTRGNDFAISCLSTASVANVPVGTHLAILKETAAGSANGVSPVTRQTNLTFINFTEANIVANCIATPATVTGTGLNAYQTRGCTVATLGTVSLPPHVGISDIDPTTFVGTGGVTLADANGLTSTSGIQVMFAPIVTEALYARLQTLQGLGATNSLANMPSLPLPVIRGIFNGQILDWSQVYINGTQVSPGGGTVFMCRRGETSGTQTSFEILFTGENCSKGGGIGAFAGPTIASCLATGCVYVQATHGNNAVFAGDGSGDVRSCMTNHTNAARFAVGISSTERRPATTGANDRYRYVRVEGVEPTLVAAQQGRYGYFTENTLNSRTGVALGGELDDIWTWVTGNIGNATAVAAVNSQFTNAGSPGLEENGLSDTGNLVIPVAGTTEPTLPIVPADVRTDPIGTQTRRYPDSPINNCNMSYQAIPAF